MMAVELRWWRVDFAKSTDGAWSRALEEGFQLKGWDTLCMEMVSFRDPSRSRTVSSMLKDRRPP